MIAGWAVILTALMYLIGLFAIAHYGDTRGRRFVVEKARPAIYALTLATYCTSWTFFGSVGLASRDGLDFLPTYIGPILVIGLGYPIVLRIVRLAKSQNITSVADFLAARYGKSEKVAAIVAIIALIGVIPYIALQLKAIAMSLTTVLNSLEAGRAVARLRADRGDMRGPQLGADLQRRAEAFERGARLQHASLDVEAAQIVPLQGRAHGAGDLGPADDLVLELLRRRAEQQQSNSTKAGLGGAVDELDRIDTPDREVGKRQRTEADRKFHGV